MKLNSKIAIITGAANGIGLSISQLFAAEGRIVVMIDVDMSKCEKEAEGVNNLGI